MTPAPISRRRLLALGAAASSLFSLGATPAPRRGGTLHVRAWDPPHFDPMLTAAFKTQVVASFTHSRLLRHAAGPDVKPGELRVVGDLAQSWTQPDETTYVFALRRGVRWHAKPPVQGRELTADDVVYSVDRFRRVTGNPRAALLAPIAGAEAIDRHTVRLTLKERSAWLFDLLANPVLLPIVAREAVAQHGDLKRAEAVVGTGPFVLERYEPNVRITLARHPGYFVPGLPHVDRVELLVDEDNASRMAAFLAGRHDIGWELPGTINRTDWLQMQAQVARVRPGLKTLEFAANNATQLAMRTDRPPFDDVRVRRAIALAIDQRELIDVMHEGAGAMNPPIPAALAGWALPIDQLGEGARYYRFDPAAARRLLAEAGHPNGLATTMDFTSFGSSLFLDAVQLVVKYLKDAGIAVTPNQKEYGAYAATTAVGKFEGLAYVPTSAFLEPDSYLETFYAPGQERNLSHVNDPVVTDLLARQRRTADVARRRETIHALQRHLATRLYYVPFPSPVSIAVWDGALRGYAPNLGYDYGGRLMGAWLER